ncbi:MAG: uracil-DNA glycosylase, partial [Mesorhizobium sp.]
MRPAELDLARYRVRLDSETDFAGWRDAARRLALNEVRPEDVYWHVAPGSDQAELPEVPARAQLVVPRDFIGHAETAFC